jgi:hypothetical protein
MKRERQRTTKNEEKMAPKFKISFFFKISSISKRIEKIVFFHLHLQGGGHCQFKRMKSPLCKGIKKEGVRERGERERERDREREGGRG